MFKTLINVTLAFFLTVAHLSIHAQGHEENIKAVMLFELCQYIFWPQSDTITSYTLGVIGEEHALKNSLSQLCKQKKIHGKQVTPVQTHLRSLKEQAPFILYVSEYYQHELKEIFETVKGKSVLIVTSNAENLLSTHINFTKNIRGEKISFEANKQNLLLSQFNYTDELLLYGGSIVDVKELFESTRYELEKETEAVEILKEQIIQQKEEIALKTESVLKLREQITNSQALLHSLTDSIKTQKSTILGYIGRMKDKEEQIAESASRLQQLNTKHASQLGEIAEAEAKIRQLDQSIKNRERTIHNQNSTLSKKEAQIETQNKALYLLILIAVLLSLSGVLIYRAYSIKRNYNRKLESTVNKRTKELRNEIARRRESENEVKRRERNYREIFNATKNAMFILDLDGNIIDTNSSVLSMYGIEKEAINKISLEDISATSQEQTMSELMNYFRITTAGKELNFDWLAKKTDGTLFWTQVSTKLSNIGGIDRVLVSVRDNDEKKKIEIELERHRHQLEQLVAERTSELRTVNKKLNLTNEELYSTNEELIDSNEELKATVQQLKDTQIQLVESEKMASIGVLAAGVAHEINNPLNFIQAGSYALKGFIEEHLPQAKDKIGTILNGIQTGVERAAKIVSSLNHFSRSSETYDESCDVTMIISNCLTMLENKLKDRVSVHKNFAGNNFTIQGNEGKLHQAFLNILANAEQAIEGAGAIFIQAEVHNEEISVTIKDTGCGIDPAIKNRIFDIFFTTKDPGIGTGMGLSITHKIITEHKGSISFESEKDLGTTVSIILPYTNKANSLNRTQTG